MVKLTIDGVTVEIAKGSTILDAACKAGIKIPTLCFLQKVSPTGACRICAVEVAGASKTMTACNTIAEEGMDITTQSDKLRQIRKQIVQLLLVNHPLDCPVCDRAGECDLQDICYELGASTQIFEAEDLSHPNITSWPLIEEIPSRCVLCEKCVKVCHEVVGASALCVEEFGDKAFINTHDGKALNCEFCGNCVAACPTGTLNSKAFKFRARGWELTKTPSVCTLCSSQCQVYLESKRGELFRVSSKDGVTVNNGNLCIGASYGHDYVNSAERITVPAVQGAEASWDSAIGAAIEGFQRYRGAAVAGLAGAGLTNEEAFLFQKLVREGLESKNIDSAAGAGVAQAGEILFELIGIRGASNPVDRIAGANAVLVVGADPVSESPALGWQIEKAFRKNDAELVVANMRPVKWSDSAHGFLQYRPGTLVGMLNALNRILVDRKLVDTSFVQQHVANYEDFVAELQKVDVAAAAASCGLRVEDLEATAAKIGNAASVAIVFGNDVLSGSDLRSVLGALSTLAVLSGALHGDLGGLFPIYEAANAQGLIDMGAVAGILPGYRSDADEKGASAILAGIEAGSVKALYLAGIDPVTELPEGARWKKALEKLEFLVVHDVFPSASSALARIVIPASVGVEKSGSMTALDHRVSPLRPAFSSLGQGHDTLSVMARIYNRLAKTTVNGTSEEMLREIIAGVPAYEGVVLSRSGDHPYSYSALAKVQGKSLRLEVPKAGTAVAGTQLLVGKQLHHFGTLTTRSASCNSVATGPVLTLSPATAEKAGLGDGATAVVKTELGEIRATVSCDPRQTDDLLFVSDHFPAAAARGLTRSGINPIAASVSKG